MTNYNNKIEIPNNNKIKIKKKGKYKINRSTNISIELNKIKNNYNSELDEDKIVVLKITANTQKVHVVK